MAELKVLIIDDEPGIRSGVKRILKDFHVTYPFMDEDYVFHIMEASTGEEGIDIIEQNIPDILLLDNKLPGIQGVDVLEIIREKKYDIAVAMITSYASLDVAVRATRDGATDFIPKPFTPQELKSSIENISKQLYLKRITHDMNQEGKKIRYQFLSVLSHELKAPLNALEGYLLMMQEKQAGDRIDDYINHIDRSLQRIQGMRNLIMDLLDFTKIRLERKDEKIQKLNLADVAAAALVTVQPYAIQMEVTVNLDVKKEIIIMADPTDIDIIFNNLTSNAVKYNKVGGKVDIIIDSDDNEVIMKFADTGIGISEDDRKILFKDFMRVKNEQTRNISGSGLGLSIVKKVVELYFGSITVESKPDKGSIFTIRLPKNLKH
ncbi:MAG: hybrid sensor histidine kinase/response regulator [Bacteroidetes bacterium]|jgi:signal transduction histidine kinase|nr:hybrid sensor histidine kinase/response regulator [Bacteroidota bacterium]